jgi:putative aldouronate transport system substrate-binding protein
MNDMLMYQEIETETNVHIDFLHPPAGQAGEQFNLMIASQDFPDIVEYSWGNYPGGVDKAIADNVIVNLTDKVQKLAPDYYRAVTEYPHVERQVKTDNGNYYAFQAIGIGVNLRTQGLIIREDWRKELGLALPETIDEITTLLTRFKNEKGAVTPYAAISAFATTQPDLPGAFGVGTGYYMVDGGKTVKYGPLEPAFKDFLLVMREWYEKGLLDPDFPANNNKARDAKFVSGQAGMVFGSQGDIMAYMGANAEKIPGFDVLGLKSPVLKKGDISNFGSLVRDMRAGGMAAIMASSSAPDLAIQWMNVFYTEQGNYWRNFGVEGVTYTWVDDYPKYTDEIMNNPDGLTVAQALLKYCRAATPSPGYIDKRYADQYNVKYVQQSNSVANYVSNLDRMLLTMMPPVTLTPEEASEASTLNTNIATYVSEMVPKFIMGTEDLGKFDAFVAQLGQLGIGRSIELNQKALDRYNAR